MSETWSECQATCNRNWVMKRKRSASDGIHARYRAKTIRDHRCPFCYYQWVPNSPAHEDKYAWVATLLAELAGWKTAADRLVDAWQHRKELEIGYDCGTYRTDGTSIFDWHSDECFLTRVPDSLGIAVLDKRYAAGSSSLIFLHALRETIERLRIPAIAVRFVHGGFHDPVRLAAAWDAHQRAAEPSYAAELRSIAKVMLDCWLSGVDYCTTLNFTEYYASREGYITVNSECVIARSDSVRVGLVSMRRFKMGGPKQVFRDLLCETARSSHVTLAEVLPRSDGYGYARAPDLVDAWLKRPKPQLVLSPQRTESTV